MNLLFELFFVVAAPWQSAMGELVADNTHRPDIAFLCVDIGIETLWRHVYGGSHIVSFLRVLTSSLDHPKIGDLYTLSLQEDVCWLEIAMDITSLQETLISTIKLIEQLHEL